MQYFKDTLEVYVLLSVPQAFIFTWLCFTFWGIRVARFFPRVIWFSLTVSAFQDIDYLAVSTSIHTINSILGSLLFIHLFFRELPFRTKLLILAMIFISAALLDLASLSIIRNFISPAEIRVGPFINKIIYIWPYFAIVAMLSAVFQQKRFYPGHRIARFINEAKDTSILTFIVMIFLQIVLLIVYLMDKYFNDSRPFPFFFYLGVASIAAVSLMAMRLIVKTKENAAAHTHNAYLGDLLHMFSAIRGQRHDFTNHVQVMYAMLRMKKNDKLAAYMKEVVDEIQSVSEMANKIPLQALAALLAAKTAIAMDKRIVFVVHTPGTTGPLDPVQTVDLVRVAGTLIDQAFNQTLTLHPGKRRVELHLDSDNGCLTIRVTAACTANPDRNAEQDPALSAVKERIRHYRGSFSVQGDEAAGIVYHARFPWWVA